MEVTVICGSRRKQSRTKVITDMIVKITEAKGHNVYYIDLVNDDIDNFKGFEEMYNETTMNAIQRFNKTDVFFIGSPVYDGLVSSGIKNLFEHMDFKALEGKVAGIITKGSNPGTNQQIRGQLVALLNYFNIFSNTRPLFVTDADFDEAGNLTNEKIQERLEKLIDSTISIKERLG